MKRVEVWVSEEVAVLLEERAKREGRPVSQMGRVLLEGVLRGEVASMGNETKRGDK